ncbi:MAG: hypothetical protein ACFFDT_10030 [Candidatus Hodarchaeota archaeon]
MNSIKVKIQSLKDQTLNTGIASYNLVKGEIFVGVFRNEGDIRNLIRLGILQEVPEDVNVYKEIPYILLDDFGKELPLSSFDERE